MTDRMPGRLAQPWCPHCHAPPGPDCPDRSPSPRQVRRRLKRALDKLTTTEEPAARPSTDPTT